MTTPPVDLYHHPYDIEAATCRDGLDLEETLRVEPQESTSRHEVYRRWAESCTFVILSFFPVMEVAFANLQRRHRSYGPNYAMFRTNLVELTCHQKYGS